MVAFLPIILGFIPGVVWLLFYLREDIHPEPKKFIVLGFVFGGLATIPVLAAEMFYENLLQSLEVKNLIIFVVGLAVIEEFFKFLGAFWLTYKNPVFDEPVDAMIYTVTVALGFATVENIFVIGDSFPLAAVGTTSLRFIGATLLHTLASGVVGFYWAKGILSRAVFVNLFRGLIFAALIHSVFNFLILRFQMENLLYPTLFLIAAAFFVLYFFERLKAAGSKWTWKK